MVLTRPRRRSLGSICVAQKMSWASRRSTTRIEDEAYCLLGIFNLNMPLLYGEEEKAFRRLQEEIIRSTVDLSILAWTLPISQDGWPTNYDTYNSSSARKDKPVDRSEWQLCGILAKSPADFWACKNYEGAPGDGLREFSLANFGIKTRVRMNTITYSTGSRCSILPLNCRCQGRYLGIHVKQLMRDNYLRTDPWTIYTYGRESCESLPPIERHFLTNLPQDYFWSTSGLAAMRETMRTIRKYPLRVETFVENTPKGFQASFVLRNPWPLDRFDPEDGVFFVKQDPEHDYGIIDALLVVSGPVQGELTGTIIALSWSETDEYILSQFSIVDSELSAHVLDRFRDQDLESWQRSQTSTSIKAFLNNTRIPRASSVQWQIEGTSFVAEMSIWPMRRSGLENYVSRELCYDLQVHARFVPLSEASPIVQEDWESFIS